MHGEGGAIMSLLIKDDINYTKQDNQENDLIRLTAEVKELLNDNVITDDIAKQYLLLASTFIIDTLIDRHISTYVDVLLDKVVFYTTNTNRDRLMINE